LTAGELFLDQFGSGHDAATNPKTKLAFDLSKEDDLRAIEDELAAV
jgi:hypothetical protein